VIFIVAMIAICVGADAADKLQQAHPSPSDWFEAGITILLVVFMAIYLIIHGNEYE
jgi:hypothetical protein